MEKVEVYWWRKASFGGMFWRLYQRDTPNRRWHYQLPSRRINVECALQQMVYLREYSWKASFYSKNSIWRATVGSRRRRSNDYKVITYDKYRNKHLWIQWYSYKWLEFPSIDFGKYHSSAYFDLLLLNQTNIKRT